MKEIIIKNIPIEKIKPSKYNPRIMSEDEIDKLKNSIKEFGLVEPLVVNKDMTLIGGHQRLKAMTILEFEKVPCILVDLNKRKEKILNLALNRIVGTWNEEKLVKLVKEVSEFPDIKLAGFDSPEIEMLNIQYDLIFGESENIDNVESEKSIKKLFDLNVRVPIDINQPQVVKNKNKIAFYTENFKQWKRIKKHFGTDKKSELDTKKLIALIK